MWLLDEIRHECRDWKWPKFLVTILLSGLAVWGCIESVRVTHIRASPVSLMDCISSNVDTKDLYMCLNIYLCARLEA